MSFTFLGMGTAVPVAQVNRDESIQVARALGHCTSEQSTWLDQVFDHSGIANRHVCWGVPAVRDVLGGTNHSQSVCLPKNIADDPGPTTRERMKEYEKHAPALACQAARKALERSGLAPRDITHLVTVTCTGFYAPGLDYALINGLGLGQGTERIQVGFMGCHGALNGFRTARALTRSDREARVLMCAVELCSLHYYYRWNAQKMIANALFADGAAAVVGAAEGPDNAWRVVASGSWLFPNSADAMTWTVGDHGFEMTLSRHVPNLIHAHLRPWLEDWLARHNLTLQQVGSWAVHPGGPKILTAVEEALDLSPGDLAPSRQILNDLGNMSSTTLLFLLERMRANLARRPCVAIGFGPGLTAEVALLA